MNRRAHLTLTLAGMGLVALFLVLAAGAQSPSQASADTIKVPDDYATIQAAIDAAEKGSTILVAEGTYRENLSLTEGITLTGGWDPTFTTQTPGDSTIDGQGLGRVISITCATSDTLVILDGFTIEGGDATALGSPPEAVPEGEHSSLHGSMPPDSQAAGDLASIAEAASRVRTHLSDLAARDLYPGGPDAYRAMAARLDRLTAQAQQAQASTRPTTTEPEQDPDCGGGIHSWNASLHLLNSRVQFNLASSTNDGLGGGIFVGQAAEAGVKIADNVIQYNIASDFADGHGGGLYLSQTPGAVIEGNHFLDNAASNGGLYGAGGGLTIDDSAGVQLRSNHVERNTAQASWDCPAMGGGGTGGGAQFRGTDDAIVADNTFRDNLAALHCGSHGGGLYVYQASNLRLEGNHMLDNTGVLYQVYSDDYGGGLGIDTVYSATLTGNELRGNAVSLVNPDGGMHVSYGGGVFGYALTDSRITANEFSANLASGDFTAFGGGMHLVGTDSVSVTHNLFDANAANLSTSGGGKGGALNLRNTVNTVVRHNHFMDNRASAAGPGEAGALSVESYGPHSLDTTVDSNLFMRNQASGQGSAHSRAGACDIVTHGLAFTNNVLGANEAAEVGGLALAAADGGAVINNTFAGNSDTAIMVDPFKSPVTFTNNIVVSHTVGISVAQGATATVRYTLWEGNGTDIAGPGAISHTHPVTGSPGFANTASYDYHLTTGSAAINAGDPAGVPPAPNHDADGVARPVGVAVDLGAYEWRGFWRYLPLVAKRSLRATGWAAGESVDGYGTIIHTTDGGETWVRQGKTGEIPDANLGGVAAIDAQNAWVVGDQGTILRTHDGGSTWQRQEVPAEVSEAGLIAVSAVDGNTAWAAGAGPNAILHTTDGGKTWTRQGQGVVPTSMDPQGVYASDAAHAWVVGSPEGDNKYGTILRTSDGGATWERQPYTLAHPPDNRYDLITIHGVDANTIWAVGHGQVIHTADGGTTWVQQALPSGGLYDVNGVFAVDHNTVWVVVDDGGIYRSDDSGANWVQQTVPSGTTGDYILRISAVDGQTAWAVTAPDPRSPSYPGHVLHTADGGQRWIAQTTPVSPAFWGVSFVR